MTCDQAELRMAELLAGELAPEDRALLDRHLLDCAACRGDFELARAGARIEWADVAVPREVVESTLASFREPGPAVRLLRWATAAAAVFGVAALLLISSRAPKPAEPPLAAACVNDRPQVLATMQEAVVGALVCKDEDGRPVGELGLKSHEVSVEILDGIAKTTVEENFENHTDRRLEGTFHFPLPSDASISRLALEVNGKIEEGTCLERERAREVFESIVRKAMDPALLEWQPGGFFKCRVFPIGPRSTKRVIVAYTQALPCFQGRMTYVYPLASEKTRTHPPGEAAIAVQARFSGGLAKIASPSHHLEVQRKDANEASMAFRATNYRPNNDFVVTMEPGEEEVRVVPHKTDGDDGYFACFATPKGGGARVPGRYAFVLDASASISAPRLEVAKRLVRAMMEKRIEGDRFEILAHNVEVERSGEVDLRAANDFMDRLRPIGGSDVLRALQAAGDSQVIYIGKGSATFGETEPSRILEAVKGLRIRTIAVGSDANGTLLEKLGGMMRVNPNDDVAKRVEEIAATLGSPVLSDVKIEGGDAVYDVVGVRDLFYGERLVVSGRYRGPTAKLVISGTGYRREVDVAFPAKEEGNNYVRRLWAQRKVSDLLAQGPAKKPEVTELGVKYQIMTPYTSFLVLETEQMWKDFQLKREVQKQDEVMGKAVEGKGKQTTKAKFGEPSTAPTTVVADPPPVEPVKTPRPTPAPVQPTNSEPRNGKSTERPDEGGESTVKKPEPFRPRGDKLEKSLVVEPPQPANPEPTKEDPKARAIREAYEEQLRRDRQEVVLSLKKGSADEKIFDEFRRQSGWNIVVDGRSAPMDYDQFMKEALVRTPTNQLGGLEFTLHWKGPLNGDSLDTDSLEGLRGYWTKMDGDVGVVLVPPQQGGGGPLTGATWTLDTENSGRAAEINDLQRYLDQVRTTNTKHEADMQVFARQREVQLAELQELTTKVEETRAKLAKSLSTSAEQRRLREELGKLEETTVEMARDKKHLEEKLNAIGSNGGNVNVAPKKALEAKVTAVANDIGLVVFSIGKDDGVLEGDEFTIYRGGDFVAKTVVDRADRKWSAGKIVLKKTDPRVADDVSNHLGVLSCTMPSHALDVMGVDEDGGVRLAGTSAAPQQVFAVTRAGRFVAMIRVDRVSASQVDARMWLNLAVGRILPGDHAVLVTDPKGYLAALPEPVRMDLSSRANQQTIRAKMGLNR